MKPAAKNVDGIELGDVLASSVHDIKNSLGLILGLVDELSEHMEQPNERSIRSCADLRYEGRRLNTNLVALLTLYRMEGGAYQVNATEVYVDDFLNECRLLHEDILATRGISIEVRPAAGVYGYFDRELVMGVVGTIINNAYRYACSRVVLEAAERDGFVSMSVVDDGPGYPPEMLRNKTVSGVSFKTGSSGLGLHFATVIAGAHRNKHRRGYINVDNDGLNGGGRFSMFLP